MDANASFNVDITDHSTVDRFVRGGGTAKITRVTYFVGRYGPFTEEFPAGQDGPDVIQAAITKRVQGLRQLSSTVY